MQVRDPRLDVFYMDVMNLLGENFDCRLDEASNVAEQITEEVEKLLEGVD